MKAINATEREIKAALDDVEQYAREGHLTVRECLEEMLKVYDEFDHAHETAYRRGDLDLANDLWFGRCRVYHNIFLRLSRLTKE